MRWLKHAETKNHGQSAAGECSGSPRVLVWGGRRIDRAASIASAVHSYLRFTCDWIVATLSACCDSVSLPNGGSATLLYITHYIGLHSLNTLALL